MADISILRTAVLAAVILMLTPGTRSEERLREVTSVTHQQTAATTGIRTDRLTPRQLRVWESIKRIVYARDASGHILHPKLHSLWQWVDASGQVIYVEMRNPKTRGDRQAGKFIMEKSDPDGKQQTGLIWLCLPVIDETLVKKRTPGSDGFIRFEGLGRKERYAEVLGHELAHAAWTLADPNNAQLLEELERLAVEFHRHCRTVRGAALDEKARQLLNRIESVTKSVEGPAESAEGEVWRELLKKR